MRAFSEFLRLLGEGRDGSASVAELYHENSKIFPARARPVPEPLRLDADDAEKTDITRYVAARPKEYPTASRIPLPSPDLDPETSFITLLMRRRSCRQFDATAEVQIADLANVLGIGFGLCRQGSEPTGRFVPSAGGLYGLEAYLVARRVRGLERCSLHHYNPKLHCLERLLATIPGDSARIELQAGLRDASALVVVTACVQRLYWKYGDRSYRLLLLEAGHAVHTAILAATAQGLATCPIGGFHDDVAHDLLGVDGVTEIVVYCLAVGQAVHDLP